MGGIYVKNCPVCDKEIRSFAGFCPFCGTAMESTVETYATLEYSEAGKPKQQLFSKKWLFIVLAAVIMVGGASVAGMFFKKSPKELFLLSEVKSYEHKKEELQMRYGEELAFQEKLQQSPSESELRVTGNIDLDSKSTTENILDQNTKSISKNILYQNTKSISENMLYQNSKSTLENMPYQNSLYNTILAVKTKQDPRKQAGLYSIAFKFAGMKSADVDIYRSETQAVIKIPELYNDFFYFNFDQYGELMRKFNPSYDGPETYELTDYKWKELELTDKELKYINRRYSAFILSELKEKNFKLKKGIKYEAEGETLKVREIALQLSKKEAEALIQHLLERMIEDEKLHTMIAKRVVKLANVPAVSEEFGSEVTNREFVEKEVKARLIEMKKNLAFPDGLKWVVYIDNDEQIIDRRVDITVGGTGKSDGGKEVSVGGSGEPDGGKEVSVAAEDPGNIEMYIHTTSIPLGENSRLEEASVELSPENKAVGKLSAGYHNRITGGESKRNEELTMDFFFESQGIVVSDMELEMKSLFNEGKAQKQTINREYILRLGGEMYRGSPQIKGSLDQMKETGDKHSNQNLVFEMNVDNGYQPGTISLTVDSKINLVDKVDLPKLDMNEGKNLTELTQSEIDQIIQNTILGQNLGGETPLPTL
jgi:hypothetical protein